MGGSSPGSTRGGGSSPRRPGRYRRMSLKGGQIMGKRARRMSLKAASGEGIDKAWDGIDRLQKKTFDDSNTGNAEAVEEAVRKEAAQVANAAGGSGEGDGGGGGGGVSGETAENILPSQDADTMVVLRASALAMR